jgi:hypothetical protein
LLEWEVDKKKEGEENNGKQGEDKNKAINKEMSVSLALRFFITVSIKIMLL